MTLKQFNYLESLLCQMTPTDWSELGMAEPKLVDSDCYFLLTAKEASRLIQTLASHLRYR